MHPLKYPPRAILVVEVHDGLPTLNEFGREVAGEHRLTLPRTTESYVVLPTEEDAINQRLRLTPTGLLAFEPAEGLCRGLHSFYHGWLVVFEVLGVLVELAVLVEQDALVGHDAHAGALLAQKLCDTVSRVALARPRVRRREYDDPASF